MTPRDDISRVDEAVGQALASRLIERGQAQRVRIVARLAGTVDPANGRTRTVSAASLADDLRISPATIHEHVIQLGDLGFDIEAVPGGGYRLGSPFSDLLVGEAVLSLLLGAQERAAGTTGADGTIRADGTAGVDGDDRRRLWGGRELLAGGGRVLA